MEEKLFGIKPKASYNLRMSNAQENPIFDPRSDAVPTPEALIRTTMQALHSIHAKAMHSAAAGCIGVYVCVKKEDVDATRKVLESKGLYILHMYEEAHKDTTTITFTAREPDEVRALDPGPAGLPKCEVSYPSE